MAKPQSAEQSGMALAWYQSLETKLGFVFLLLLAMLTGGAYFANRVLVRDGLLDESQRYEDEVASRDAQSLNDAAHYARIFASTLVELAAVSNSSKGALEHAAPGLAATQPFAGAVAAFGLWPEAAAGSTAKGTLWLRDGRGGFVPHQEMNGGKDPYFREPWYTPGRYLMAGMCFWTGIRQELVSNLPVISCVMPIFNAGNFGGVVTVSISVETLADRLNSLQHEHNGYLFMLDGNYKLLAATSNADGTLGNAQRGESLAALAREHPDLLPVATGLQKQAELAVATVVKSSRYQAANVSALRDASRGLTRDEAESILINIWRGTRQGGSPANETLRIALEHDAGSASVYFSGEAAWHLVRVAPANTSFAGVSYVFTQALMVTMVLVTLILLIVYYSMRAVVIRPLRLFARQLEASTSVDDAINVTLDESARNEVGLLAHWQNERVRQLADALSATRSAKSQLSAESGERKQLQEQLARSQERSTLALQSVADAVVITDELGQIEGFNPAAESFTGVSLRQARGRLLDEVLKIHSAADSSNAPNFARLVIERGTRLDYPDDLVLTAVNGQTREIALSAAPIHARGGITGAVIVFRDRSPRGQASVAVAVAVASEDPSPSNRDGITGLPTRSACEHRIEALLEQIRHGGNSATLIYLDVDHLKRVNDTGGQAAGDDVLVRTAETIAGVAPQPGNVYRLSADQFAVIAADTDALSGVSLAEGLRARLASTRFYWESRHFTVTGSLGVSVIDKECNSALEVIRRADDACSAAKRAGRNCVRLYEARMDRVDRQVDDEAWVRCIRRGLTDNLFHLRTQWIMPSSENAAEGHAFEILLALEDDEGFWASPAAFMPVAERHHMMAEIDRWVISNALSYLESHPQIVKTLAFCSVNLAALTMTDPGFLEFMVGQLEHRLGLANKLCFEVREITLTEHPNDALICCDALHKMGCRISVDHYLGRYMSDLTVMRRLPVDYVKVDALSYKNLSSDPVEQMLAESTFRIARHLRRRVIVTGIEDVRAQETWRKLGANYFQGFAFAKPSPVVFLPPE